MKKRVLSLLLAVSLIASVMGACSAKTDNHKLVTETTTEQSADTSNFKLSYSQSDSLNPYRSETLNNQIVQMLVFDSLFILDENYEAQPSMATSYSYTDNKTLDVTIPSGIVFSDGSSVDSGDVVRSFNEAKDSPRWKNNLKAIDSAYAKSNTVISFNLAYSNPNAHNLLTFAIAKGSEDKKGYPIGSGRYKFAEGGGEVYLTVNKKYDNFSPSFTKIVLINITSNESIENAINIGNISWAFRDLASGDKVRMKCSKKAVNINNLVYIGLNGYTSITSDVNIRRAISLAVDRDTLVKSSFQGYAKSAVSIFNPVSALGQDTAVFSSGADIAAAKQAVSQSKYKKEDLKIDILTNKNSNRAAAAQLIKQQLEAVGFKVTINKEDNKTYKYKVEKRAFDIYIGETKLTNDMNLYSFFKESGATHYGIDLEDSSSAKAYKSYMDGKSEIGKFVLEFSQEMPFVPLVYRQGMICYSKSMHGDMQGYYGNYFSNIEDWYYN